MGDRAPNTHKILTMSIFDPEVISLGQASLFIDDRMNPLQSKFRSLPGRVSHPIKTPNNRLQTHYNRKSDPSKIIFPTRRDGLRWDVLGATEPVKTPVLSLPRAYQFINTFKRPKTATQFRFNESLLYARVMNPQHESPEARTAHVPLDRAAVALHSGCSV